MTKEKKTPTPTKVSPKQAAKPIQKNKKEPVQASVEKESKRKQPTSPPTPVQQQPTLNFTPTKKRIAIDESHSYVPHYAGNSEAH